MTEAQTQALQLLLQAYDEDVLVALATKTQRLEGRFTINRNIAQRLVEKGLARYSQPAGKFLFITGPGFRFARAEAA